uniref:Sulfur globule protein n=1 Tax=Bosea sp. NBC_00436 TaxID=2969620 RepID=A0A9E7ZWL1_9HYPH
MLKVVVGAAALAIATVGGMVGSAQAADGCGAGWHRDVYGFCRPNYRPYVYGGPVVVGPVWRGPVYHAWGPRRGWGGAHWHGGGRHHHWRG